MSEKAIRISESGSGKYLAFRDAFELGSQGESRVIQRLDRSIGKFMTPVGPVARGATGLITAADTFDLTALPSELVNYALDVGDGSALNVAVEQSVSDGTLTITPILFDDYTPPNVVGVLPAKTFVQPYAYRRGTSYGQYTLPTQAWDVCGAHKIGLQISAISGTSNKARVYAWIDGDVVDYSDPYFRNVVLLLPMNGDNNGVQFPDYSKGSLGCSVNGNAITSTAQYKFGGSSAYFDGNGDYLSYSDSDDWDMGALDFTVEAWVWGASDAPNYAQICGQRSSAGDATCPFGITKNNTANTLLAGYADGTSFYNITGSRAVYDNNWHHVALVRDGDTFRLFVDGIADGTRAVHTAGYALYQSPEAFCIGRQGAYNAQYFKGYIQDFRLTKGVARYKTNFTPHAAALPVIEIVNDDPHYFKNALLLHGIRSNNSTNIRDSGPVNHVITRVGNSCISTTQYKFGGSSLYFDGNGDYLTVPSHYLFDLCAYDFTIEAWIRPTAWAAKNGSVYNACIIGKDVTGTTTRSWQFVIWGTASSFTTLQLYLIRSGPTPTAITAAHNFSLDTWYHVMATRKSNKIYLFVDGVLKNAGGTDYAYTIQTSTTTVRIGGMDYDATYKQYFTGYMQDIRVTRGVARYISDFSIPTTLLPSNRER